MRGGRTSTVNQRAIQSDHSEHVDRLAAATTFTDSRICRGVPTPAALAWFGEIFSNSHGNEETYNMSKNIAVIDVFVSHNWSTPRWLKFLAMVLYLNLGGASKIALVLVIVCWAVGVAGVVFFVVCLVFPMLLLTLHELYRLTGSEWPTLFIDKVCIHQSDVVLKNEGIKSLGAFLKSSERMLVVYRDGYLQRLWTVYELATMLLLKGHEKIDILPVFVPCLIFGLTVANAATCLAAAAMILAGVPQWGAVFTLVSLPTWVYFAMRVWSRSRRAMEDDARLFDIRSARCFNESDRALVENNVVSFAIASGVARADAPREIVLEVFNEMVRMEVPAALSSMFGLVGISWQQAMASGSGILSIMLFIMMRRPLPEMTAYVLGDLMRLFSVVPNNIVFSYLFAAWSTRRRASTIQDGFACLAGLVACIIFGAFSAVMGGITDATSQCQSATLAARSSSARCGSFPLSVILAWSAVNLCVSVGIYGPWSAPLVAWVQRCATVERHAIAVQQPRAQPCHADKPQQHQASDRCEPHRAETCHQDPAHESLHPPRAVPLPGLDGVLLGRAAADVSSDVWLAV